MCNQFFLVFLSLLLLLVRARDESSILQGNNRSLSYRAHPYEEVSYEVFKMENV